MYSESDRHLDLFLTNRHGPFSRHMCRRLGFTDRMIDGRLATGRWRRLHRGVYCVASAPVTDALRYEAATLAAPNAVLSGLAAAHLHRLERCGPAAAEITIPRSGNARVHGVRVRRRDIARAAAVGSIPVTSIEQTLLDITPRLPFDRLEAALDTAFLSGGLRRDLLAGMVDRAVLFRPAGGALFRSLAAERLEETAHPESVLELGLLRILRSIPDVGKIVTQARFDWWKGGRGRFDVSLPLDAVMLEADGRTWHARVAAFDEDRWRDATAAAHGHLVLRFSATQIRHRAGEVRHLVAETLRHRRQRAA